MASPKRQKATEFPIDLGKFDDTIKVDPSKPLSDAQAAALKSNVQVFRDACVFSTATGGARGYGGHTGGPFDTAPEVCILRALFRSQPDKYVPIHFDEAGHRVMTQYILSALDGDISADELCYYRVGNRTPSLPGHPELGHTPGVKFSSGRLGHMWGHVNGVAFANPGKTVFCLGSDGSQMEGNDAEAARIAVAKGLEVKLVVDDNDVTIAGHPSSYMPGYSVQRTLEGHGIPCVAVDGEDVAAVFGAIAKAVATKGPFAVICKRTMSPGTDVEGVCKAHDVFAVGVAVSYLEKHGQAKAAEYLKGLRPSPDTYKYRGVAPAAAAMRVKFGTTMADVIKGLSAEEKQNVIVIDSDLEGSTGLKTIREQCPEVYQSSGVMERGNFAAAAGFGQHPDKQGVFSTFAAFSEMVISELTMARLNKCNVLCHFSHSGMDDMADNTCHFGINNMFCDNGLEDDQLTRLYFPSDELLMDKVIRRVYGDKGCRFIFSVRSKTPLVLDSEGKPAYGDGYEFQPDKDHILRKGTAGYIVSFGDALYRCMDAVEQLREQGVDVGLVNKITLNTYDEEVLKEIGSTKFVMVVECLNRRTGLGSRLGTQLLLRGLSPKYKHLGTTKEGCGGLYEHYYFQGMDPMSIIKEVRTLL